MGKKSCNLQEKTFVETCQVCFDLFCMKNRRLWLQMKMILIVRRTPEGGLNEQKCGLDYDAEAAHRCVCVRACACVRAGLNFRRFIK